MPRKPLIYTHEVPYHIWSRTNNKEWFKLNKDLLWNIFTEELNHAILKFDFHVYAFVLMDNHYHLIAQTSKHSPLNIVMQTIQSRVTRKINNHRNSINKVFGGRYRASLIRQEGYFIHAYKYVLRNPVEASLCQKVELYPYSTANEKQTAKIHLCSYQEMRRIFQEKQNISNWLNESYSGDTLDCIKTGIHKSEMSLISKQRKVNPYIIMNSN